MATTMYFGKLLSGHGTQRHVFVIHS